MAASLRSIRFDVARTLLAFLAAAVPGCVFAQSDFTLAAAGDLIIPRPVSMLQNEGAFPYAPAFRDAVTLLGAADVTYGNLETTIYDPRSFTGSPYSWNGDWMLTSLPAVAADLRAMHVGIVSRSNNHALDWGLEGMRETTKWVNAAGLVQAGIGETADEAAAASYYQSAKGKVAIVSMVTTFRPTTNALPISSQAPSGRPGVNGLAVTQTSVVDAQTYGLVNTITCAFAGTNPCPTPGPVINFFGSPVRAVTTQETPFTYTYSVDAVDEARIMAGIGAAKSGSVPARYVVVAIHAHEAIAEEDPPSSWQDPAAFLKTVARKAVDSGADAFITTGIHHVAGMEIYKGKAIFYGLGNFFWGDMQEPLSAELYDSIENREFLEESFDCPERATDADLTNVLNANSTFATVGAKSLNRTFQTVLVRVVYDDGLAGRPVKQVFLYPINLGYGEKLTQSGVPRQADDTIAKSVLDRMIALSDASNVTITTTRQNGYLIGMAVPKAESQQDLGGFRPVSAH
jgi:poly-gamma-glutamate capsule biosynthesis protein CapA/YwtB (metallophosphatase superfamily)